MARKDLLKSVMDTETDSAATASRSSYAMRGASKSMKVSIDSLAENSRKMLDGETILTVVGGGALKPTDISIVTSLPA